MAEKNFVRQFASDFTGINAECSSLEPEGNEVNRATNLELGAGNSLRGRTGCQIAGSPGSFFGIFNYAYTRTQDEYKIKYQAPAAGVSSIGTTKTSADGATINKLVAINQQMWMQDWMDIPVTVALTGGSYPIGWYADNRSTPPIRFYIDANGFSQVGYSCGDGITGGQTIWDILNTINGVFVGVTLGVSRTTRGVCPPFAIATGAATVPGASAVFGTIYQLAVNNTPHNFYPGDIITFPNMTGGIVVARTAATIDYVGPRYDPTAGTVLGYMNQTPAAFPVAPKILDSAGDIVISFPYWRLILEGDATTVTPDYGICFKEPHDNTLNSASTFAAPPVAANAGGCLYIASSSRVGLTAKSSFSYNYPSYPGNLVKTDGATVLRAGLPNIITSALSSGGVGALVGLYKYKFFLRRRDAQGNIIEGPVSNIESFTAANNYLRVRAATCQYGDYTGWSERSCHKNGAAAIVAATAFAVDNLAGAAAFIQPGDKIVTLNNSATIAGLTYVAGGAVVGQVTLDTCTDYDGTTMPVTIKVATGGYTIPDNEAISTGLTMVVLRTTAGGNQYYYLAELPMTGYSAAIDLYDNATDANLIAKEQYIEIPLGKEHNAPPPCALVCVHQGGLVTGRNPANPSTISFSSADGLEYFPLASNSFDIPSTIEGHVTAIASDTSDRLAVFKDRAYYDVVGDLDGGSFQINIVNEGDYGISSQASMARVSNVLVGVCPAGFVAISDGRLNAQGFRKLSARLINQSWAFGYATAVNDSFSRSYHCSIPTTSALTETNVFSIDYSREDFKFLDKLYNSSVSPTLGFAMLGTTLYHLNRTTGAVYRRLQRFNGDSPTGSDSASYVDNVYPINYVFESQPINFGEPGLLKTPLRVRVWSIQNDYIVNGWVPFNLLVETGAWPDVVYLGGAYNGGTSCTVPFLTSTTLFKDVKLIAPKCHFYIIRLSTNTAGEAPFITGYEIAFNANYQKEDFVK